jgi:ribosomal protein S18 acetylase RimI-like enzyme
MPCVIRAAQLPDAESVLALWADSAAEPTHTDNLESLAGLMAWDPGALLLAVDDCLVVGSIIAAVDDCLVVGSIIAAFDGWRGSVYRLVVARPHRHRGLGNLLLSSAEARLEAVRALRLQTIVVETDQPATSFWQTTSWQRQSERLRFTKA